MSNNPLRVVFFTEEGSNFGKLHFAALLQLPGVEMAAVVVSPFRRKGSQRKNPGKTPRDRIRHAVWRRLHKVTGLSPEVDLTAFDMATESWVRNIDFLRPRRIRRKAFIQKIRDMAPDVIFCAGHQQIFPEALIQVSKLATINFHPSLLPACRGRNPWFWTILTGQTQTGITAHHMTRGVDEGDIIIQEKVPLTGKETYTELYDRLNRLSADMVPNVVALCRTGNLPRIPQHPGGSIFSEPTETDYRIDWARPAVEIERQVRACMIHPGATTEINGEMLTVCEADVEEKSGTPGIILEIAETGVVVSTGDGAVCIRRIRHREKEQTASEAARILNWQTGDRFS